MMPCSLLTHWPNTWLVFLRNKGMLNLPVMLITGSSKGIGRDLAEHFINHGYFVVGCSRGATTIKHEKYKHYQVDVGDSMQVKSCVRSIKREYDRIDVLLCNAASASANLLLTMTSDEVLEDVLAVNVRGTFAFCREVAKLMLLQKTGSIITVSSMAVGLHEEGTSAYAASKSAIVEMTKILAKELALKGITCNVIAPSVYMTEALDALGESITQRALNKLTIPRPLTIQEIAHVISFLIAPESRCITGQVIHMGLVT